MNWKKKRVLVTGAGGFIGSHLVERLLEEGAWVRGFVRYNSRSDEGFLTGLARSHANRLEILSGDLCAQETVREALRGVTVVLHLAALVGIPYSYLHPAEVVETERRRDAERPSGRPRRGGREAGPHLKQRGLWIGPPGSHRGGSPPSAPISLLGDQDRCGRPRP